MLRIIVEEGESFNNVTQEFETTPAMIVDFEHSLISLSKWESKYQKPFLSSGEKTREEAFGYLEAMLLTPVDPDVLYRFTAEQYDQLQSYIDSSQSATTFGSNLPERRGPGERITSELIYYWMVAYNIPFTCETWHLNRLFALIRICNLKNQKPKKMSRNELAQRNAALNAERRAALGTRG